MDFSFLFKRQRLEPDEPPSVSLMLTVDDSTQFGIFREVSVCAYCKCPSPCERLLQLPALGNAVKLGWDGTAGRPLYVEHCPTWAPITSAADWPFDCSVPSSPLVFTCQGAPKSSEFTSWCLTQSHGLLLYTALLIVPLTRPTLFFRNVHFQNYELIIPYMF